jgi:pantetheine-phosphate adenylyltransferase
MSTRKALYPGSFDPPTLGHLNILKRARPYFDKVYVLIAESPNKKALFSPSDRKLMFEDSIREEFKSLNIPNAAKEDTQIEVVTWTGLSVDFMKKNQIKTLVRGVRNASDFSLEQSLSNVNSKLYKDCETLLFCSKSEFTDVSSSLVKELARLGGDFKAYVSKCVEQKLLEVYKN